jgi:hypothetical protein
MAKPKRPRIGDKPKHVTKYMMEIIYSTTDQEKVEYKHFDKASEAKDAFDGFQSMGFRVRVFRIETRLVREKQT